MNKIFKITIVFSILGLFLTSCGISDKVRKIYKPVDLVKEPLDPDKRAQKNIEEGRGISLKNLGDNSRGTTYEFSTSNPMWRAALDSLDFIPLTTVDYSGGLIITDWYNDGNTKNESIKIIVRFLSNEVRSNSLKIVVHKKKCLDQNNCPTKIIRSAISEELTRVILTKAATLEKQLKVKK